MPSQAQIQLDALQKVIWFKEFLKSDDEILAAFTQLGKVDEAHSDVLEDLGRFVCKVYLPGTDLYDMLC